MPTFKIWCVGTRECSIEEAISEREACEKTGLRADECEVQPIPEENIIGRGGWRQKASDQNLAGR